MLPTAKCSSSFRHSAFLHFKAFGTEIWQRNKLTWRQRCCGAGPVLPVCTQGNSQFLSSLLKPHLPITNPTFFLFTYCKTQPSSLSKPRGTIQKPLHNPHPPPELLGTACSASAFRRGESFAIKSFASLRFLFPLPPSFCVFQLLISVSGDTGFYF